MKPDFSHPLDQAPKVSNQRHVRDCLGMFATGVTVVTTRTPTGNMVGLTASSFNTLSLGPPMVLWSLGLGSTSLSVFKAAQHFVVNVLESSQLALAKQFARPVADRFADVPLHFGHQNLPLIDGALAWFECETRAMHEIGDHVLFIGEVQRCARIDGSPLLFRKGEFAFSKSFGDDTLPI